MTDAFASGLFFPALVLALLAWLVPKLLSFLMPEGVKPLMVLAFLSAVILFAISGVYFFLLYVWRGAPGAELADFGLVENLVFFGRLALTSTIIWAPIMVLSVAALPRHWVKETW